MVRGNWVLDKLHKHAWKASRWFRLKRSRLKRHPTMWERIVTGTDLLARRIADTVDTSVDLRHGYHWHGTHWWTNLRCPYCFQYPSIAALYPDGYFVTTPRNAGHPTERIAEDLVGYMQSIFTAVFGRQMCSVLELGCGAGEITRQFLARNLDFCAVEGAPGGVERLKCLGIPEERIVLSDLKRLKPLGRKYDLVMCTEVAEHVEPWFASKVVEACISHADVVWFSAAEGRVRPHYHHMNEVPIEAWDNIFAHMGFSISIQLDGRHHRADRLYLATGLEHLVARSWPE